MRTTEKLAIATELLDRALRMYYEGDSYFAALHLAGAAEEVLAVYVKRYGGPSAFDSLRDTSVLLSKCLYDDGIESKPNDIAYLMNRAKNATKHMYGKKDTEVRFDVQSEAKAMLDLAVSNYYYLASCIDLPETDLLRRFNAELRKA